jgi:phage N-6-adenine-methyltransferase
MSSLAMTQIERTALVEYEAVIAKHVHGFRQVGAALMAIRDQRLYRTTHGTFEQYCAQRWSLSSRHVNRQIEAAVAVEQMGPVGPKPASERQVRELLAAPPEDRDEAWGEAVEAAGGEQPTSSQVRAAVRGEALPDDNDAWQTPAQYIKLAREVMGVIDVDPASSDEAQKTVCADEWHCPDDDGLAYEWHGNVWLNPPYSDPLCRKFIGKLIGELDSGRAERAILLINNTTDTLAVQTAMRRAAAICFTRGRIAFIGKNGKPVQGNRTGQMFLFFGCDPETVKRVFGSVGVIVATV